MSLKKEVFDYIQNNTNWTIEDKKLTAKFPIYIKASYDLWYYGIVV